MHQIELLTTLAGALAFALLAGAMTQRLGLSTLVGYVLAGVVVGPYTPGFNADQALAAQMSEIGVVLLMFGVGLHFHPQELLRVRRIAVPGAVVQSAVAAVAGWALARSFGWSHIAGIVFGFSLAVASTVVLMRMLVERGRLAAHDGHVAVGWLIVEDLFTVAALVVLPALAVPEGAAARGAVDVAADLGLALLKVAAFGAIVVLAGLPTTSRLLERVARTRSSELFTMAVFVLALGTAVVAASLFGVSVALGAFFGGLVVGQSRFGPQAAADMAPFRDVFTSLFFVSVGMLFNPAVLLEQPLRLLAALGIVLLLKPLAAVLIVMALRGDRRTAGTVGVGLAQVGEFSFILASLGIALGVLPREAMDLVVAAAIVSIALNPPLFGLVERWLGRTPSAGAAAPAAVVLAGYGPLGRRVARRCLDDGVPVVVIDDDPAPPRQGGPLRVFGDAARAEVLQAAHLDSARVLVVADFELPRKLRVCSAARALNPHIHIVASADGEAEAAWLAEFGAAVVREGIDEQSARLHAAVRGQL